MHDVIKANNVYCQKRVKVMIDVLMALHYGDDANLLDQCLKSLVNQTYNDFVVRLVIDGPIGDELWTIISKYKNSLNIDSIALANNVGFGAALNIGLSHCENVFVVRVDPDDYSLPNRFSEQIKFMVDNPELVAASAQIIEFDELKKLKGDVRSVPTDFGELIRFAKFRSPLNHPAVILRRCVIIESGGYPELRKGQDYALWSRLLMDGHHLGNTDKVLVRMSTSNMLAKRSSFSSVVSEVKVIHFQYSIGFLTKFEFCRNAVLRVLLRLLGVNLQRVVYRCSRRIF